MNSVNLFWSNINLNKTHDQWVNSKAVFSPHHALSIYSHSQKNKVYLITYHNDTNIQSNNVEIINANTLYSSKDAYQSLLNGNSIAHISDYVRIKKALTNNGVVLDMDAVSINDFPTVDGFIASLPAKKTSSMAIKFGKTRQPIKVHDKSWDGEALSSFPTKPSPKSAELFNALLNKIYYYLSKPKDPKIDWNFVMYGLQEITRRCDDMIAFPPITFGAIPAWKKSGNCYSLESKEIFNGQTSKFGYVLPSVEEIMQKASVVQHFYESAFKNTEIQFDSNFWKKLNSNTFLAYEAKHVVGENWRSILTDYYHYINE